MKVAPATLDIELLPHEEFIERLERMIHAMQDAVSQHAVPNCGFDRLRCLRVVSLCMCAVREAAIVLRLSRALCVDSCVGPGCSRFARAEARSMVCSMPHATAVLASAVARCVIAHRSARRPAKCRWARWRVRGARWGTVDPLGMFALPRIHVGARPERLRPVPRAF